MFLNYGTPHRSVHGKVVARAFIQKAKKAAKKPIKAEQEKTLTEIVAKAQRKIEMSDYISAVEMLIRWKEEIQDEEEKECGQN